MEPERHPNQSFDKWKGLLKTGLGIADSIGLSEGTQVEIGKKLGGFLSGYVDPMNHEQRVLKEMWDVGDDNDRIVITKLVSRMVNEEHPESNTFPGQTP